MAGVEPSFRGVTSRPRYRTSTPTIVRAAGVEPAPFRPERSVLPRTPRSDSRRFITSSLRAETQDRTELAGFSDQCNHQACSLGMWTPPKRGGAREGNRTPRAGLKDRRPSNSESRAFRAPCGIRTRLPTLRGW